MSIAAKIKAKIKSVIQGGGERDYSGVQRMPENLSSAEYWTLHNVTEHKKFASREDSLAFLRFRFDQYPHLENIMPCSGFDGKVILDYGCGPGHDVVGFVEHSKPGKVIAMDVSSSSLAETKERVKLHKASEIVDIKLIKEKEPLPLEDNSVDYIHSSGVLHHTPNMPEILDEFRRVLKPGGIIRIMVYNYESIWAHLYVPYVIQMVWKVNSGQPLRDALRRSTDGDHCPIANFYSPQEYLDICSKSGLKGKYLGAAISLDEIDWAFTYRNRAMRDARFPEEHRQFLLQLTFNEKLWPMYKGTPAGIDAVFELTK